MSGLDDWLSLDGWAAASTAMKTASTTATPIEV